MYIRVSLWEFFIKYFLRSFKDTSDTSTLTNLSIIDLHFNSPTLGCLGRIESLESLVEFLRKLIGLNKLSTFIWSCIIRIKKYYNTNHSVGLKRSYTEMFSYIGIFVDQIDSFGFILCDRFRKKRCGIFSICLK